MLRNLDAIVTYCRKHDSSQAFEPIIHPLFIGGGLNALFALTDKFIDRLAILSQILNKSSSCWFYVILILFVKSRKFGQATF